MISVDGIVLPNRPLSNLQIADSLKKLRIPSFRGVFVRDALPKTPNNKNSPGDEKANVNFYNIAHVDASAYAH